MGNSEAASASGNAPANGFQLQNAQAVSAKAARAAAATTLTTAVEHRLAAEAALKTTARRPTGSAT
ncbi:hypothetical protein [Nitratireductor sp. XY-223]|uniref:hypothetical protein n=1 Tax=Nitratireductor sp. XY-223 TaxID=2561926 RepID=UPI0010AB2D5B|nr:hypothetical protein [Nitratireductor sp. XY-223]